MLLGLLEKNWTIPIRAWRSPRLHSKDNCLELKGRERIHEQHRLEGIQESVCHEELEVVVVVHRRLHARERMVEVMKGAFRVPMGAVLNPITIEAGDLIVVKSG